MNTDTTTPSRTINGPTRESLQHQARIGEYAEPDDARFFLLHSKMQDCDLRLRWLMGRAVIRQAVRDILSELQEHEGRRIPSYCITVHDGEDVALGRSRDLGQIMDAIGACDEERLFVRNFEDTGKGPGSLFLVHGNDGWDVIADHTNTPVMCHLLQGADTLSLILSGDLPASDQGTAMASTTTASETPSDPAGLAKRLLEHANCLTASADSLQLQALARDLRAAAQLLQPTTMLRLPVLQSSPDAPRGK